ncbi:MAG: hypothetical protein ACXVGO_04990 [Mycobacterium sp.]
MDTAGRIRQIAVPATARALCGLSQIDYADAFFVESEAAGELTGEQWARAVLADAPTAVKGKLLAGWAAIGLIPAVQAPRGSLLGWGIRSVATGFVVYGRSSLIGMPGELLFRREDHGLLFATFVQQDNPIARAVWAATEPRHLMTVRSLLEQADRRVQLATRTTGVG